MKRFDDLIPSAQCNNPFLSTRIILSLSKGRGDVGGGIAAALSNISRRGAEML
jgi:hypothetical protein